MQYIIDRGSLYIVFLYSFYDIEMLLYKIQIIEQKGQSDGMISSVSFILLSA